MGKRNSSKPISYKTVKNNTTLDDFIANDKPELKEEHEPKEE